MNPTSIDQSRSVSYADLQEKLPGVGIQKIRHLEHLAQEKRPQLAEIIQGIGGPVVEPSKQNFTGPTIPIMDDHDSPAKGPGYNQSVLSPPQVDTSTRCCSKLGDPTNLHHSSEKSLLHLGYSTTQLTRPQP